VVQHHRIKVPKCSAAGRFWCPVGSVDQPICTHPIRSRAPAAFVACLLPLLTCTARCCMRRRPRPSSRGARPGKQEKRVCRAYVRRGSSASQGHTSSGPVSAFPSTRRVRALGAVISAYERSGGILLLSRALAHEP
jgi:hypothetical protein